MLKMKEKKWERDRGELSNKIKFENVRLIFNVYGYLFFTAPLFKVFIFSSEKKSLFLRLLFSFHGKCFFFLFKLNLESKPKKLSENTIDKIILFWHFVDTISFIYAILYVGYIHTYYIIWNATHTWDYIVAYIS